MLGALAFLLPSHVCVLLPPHCLPDLQGPPQSGPLQLEAGENDPHYGMLLGFQSQMNGSHSLYPRLQPTSHGNVLLVAPKKTGQKYEASVKYLPL